MSTIRSNDGGTFTISREAAKLADYLNTLCDMGNDDPIDFPEATAPILEKLIQYLEIAKDHVLPRITRPLKNKGDLSDSGVEPWALAFLESLFSEKDAEAAWKCVFDLLILADFVHAPSLVELLTAKVASRVAAMDRDTKSIIFKTARVLTEEEIADIKAKHAWAMMNPPGED